MRNITFQESIDEFIASQPEGGMKFKDKKINKDGLKKIFKSIDEYALKMTIGTLGAKQIREDIMDSIQKSRISKEKLHYVNSRYIEFMNKNYFYDKPKSEQIKELPPHYSDLERRILIAKKMHSEFNLSEIAREFLVSERTIQNDLESLNNGEVSIFNQQLKIEYKKRRNGHIEMESKAHPLFLVENLTQIIAILNGLGLVSRRDPEIREYAEKTAVSIWKQLSDNAKNRILYELVDMLKLNRKWYNRISELSGEEKRGSIFKRERESSKNQYYYFLKNRQPCFIEYVDDDGNMVKQYVTRIKGQRENRAICYISEENRDIEIDKSRIENITGIPPKK